MTYTSKLIGREKERAALRQVLQQALNGRGGLLLVDGEAGMGKTRLVDEVLNERGQLHLRYACQELRTPAFAPVAAILRQYMDQASVGLKGMGPLSSYLNLLLPELGSPPEERGDQSTLLEAIHIALSTLSNTRQAAIVIDDLQWADNATLDFILSLENHLPTMPMMLIGIYRSDEIPRGHPLRWLRTQLRRNHTVRELTIKPLTEAYTTRLAEAIIGERISASLANILYQRSDGVPLFIEQFAVALASEGMLQPSVQGMQLADDYKLSIPETIRDVVLLRLDSLAEEARRFAEVAAVLGERFDLAQVIKLAGGDAGLDQLFERRLFVESPDQSAAFHHALTREVIYQEITWTRRHRLHQIVAKQLAEEGVAAELVADHWLAARDIEQARTALAKAAYHACNIHAYRDAAGFSNRALELWSDGQEEEARLAVVEQFGNCAQLAGMLPEAARAWREASDKHRQLEHVADYAFAQQRLATVLELQGAWTQTIAARTNAATSFSQADQSGEAAAEYLALANMLHNQGQYSPALQYAEEARIEARKAGHSDLLTRATGLSGRLLAKLGHVDEGLKIARDALTESLAVSDSSAAVENFLHLASALEQESDYVGSQAAYEEAIGHCNLQGLANSGQVCLGCLAFVLWHLGDWDRVLTLATEVAASDETPELMKSSSIGLIGRIHLFRGDVEGARPLIRAALVDARRVNNFNALFTNEWGMAMIAAQENRAEAVREHWQQAYEAWEGAEDFHYGIDVFRWGATYFAMNTQPTLVQQSISALNRIVTNTSNSEAIAGLAHALGESLLLQGYAGQAVAQFEQALALLTSLDVPYSIAQTLWRLGVALIEDGNVPQATERLKMAQGMLRDLDARPDYQTIEDLLIKLGDLAALSPDDARNKRVQRAGLTRRQIEVLRLLTTGMTNREIAEKLVLSPRTVEMHVANVLNKLGCVNRTEAVARGAELGLL